MNLSKLIPFLVRLLVYVYAVNAFSYMYADTDLWGHLKFGQDILEQKGPSWTDSYSYTALGSPWINHEWLMEILFYAIFAAAGSPGLVIFKLVLGLAIVHILSQMYFKHASNLWVYAAHFLLLTHVIANGFATRPQLATLLFTALLVWALHNYFEGNKNVVYGVPLLVLIWVNCHGGVIAGWGILGMAAAVETMRCLRGRVPLPVPLLTVFGLSCAALFANPHGHELLMFFLQTIPRERIVSEWGGIPLWGTEFLYFKVLVILFFLTFFNGQSKRLWEVSIVLFAVVFAFRHQRHASLAAIVMIPYLSLQWAAFCKARVKTTWKAPQWGVLAGAVLLLALSLWQAGNHVNKFTRTGFRLQVNPAVFPVYAVGFMKDNQIGGNILLPFDWGEYVIWKLPGSRVSNDGRFWTVYPNKVLLQNLIFHNGWETWQHMLDLYPHEVILTNNRNQSLERVSSWVKVYQDVTSRVFVKKTEPPGPVLKKFYQNEMVFRDDPPSLDFP